MKCDGLYTVGAMLIGFAVGATSGAATSAAWGVGAFGMVLCVLAIAGSVYAAVREARAKREGQS